MHINHMRQNRVGEIASDLWGRRLVHEEFGYHQDSVFGVLLNRGVFKWLLVRTLIIRLKLKLRGRITDIHREIAEAKANGRDTGKLKGELRGVVSVYQELKAICKMPRLIAPFERDAEKFVAEMRKNEK